MNSYIFQIEISGQMTSGNGVGNSAIEAFEDAVAQGFLSLPHGIPFDVYAINDKGVGIKFSAIVG